MSVRGGVVGVFVPLLLVGCTHRSSPPYRLFPIEMRVREWAENRNSEYDENQAYIRCVYAGPSIVPELAEGLESDNKKNVHLASEILHRLIEYKQWPEAYALAIERLGRLPPREEAGELLFALAQEGVKNYPEVLLLAAVYLEYEDVVRVLVVNNPDNRVEMRICDYSAYIIQAITDIDFGAALFIRSDEAVSRARAWVEGNIIKREGRTRVISVPDSILRDNVRKSHPSRERSPTTE